MAAFRILFLFFIACGLSSCIVHAPKYSGVDKVLTLKLGMTAVEVSAVLGITPYNFISLNDSGEYKLLYKYRVTDRAVVPFYMNETNGKPVKGKFVNLIVTYNKDGKATHLESCNDCDETIVKEKKVDFNKLMTFISVTLPAILIYIGIQNAP